MKRPPLASATEVAVVSSGISWLFSQLFQTAGQVTYVLLTRAPLYSPPEGDFLARLACVRHAASVRSEPGSNSPVRLQTAPEGTAYALERQESDSRDSYKALTRPTLAGATEFATIQFSKTWSGSPRARNL